MLAKMFAPDSTIPPALKTEDGAFFLDRSPEVFKVILLYASARSICISNKGENLTKIV